MCSKVSCISVFGDASVSFVIDSNNPTAPTTRQQGSRQQATSSKRQAASNKEQGTSKKQPETSNQQPATCNQQATSNKQQAISNNNKQQQLGGDMVLLPGCGCA
jgi:hypothetical protein